jgi:hypothetical protein
MSLLTKLLLRCCCTTPEEPECSCNIPGGPGVQGLPDMATVTLDGDIDFVPTTTCVSGQCSGATNSATVSFKFVSHPPTSGTWDLPRSGPCGIYRLDVTGAFTLNRFNGSTGCSGTPTAITTYMIRLVLGLNNGVHVLEYSALRTGATTWAGGVVPSWFFNHVKGRSGGLTCFPAPLDAATTCEYSEDVWKNELLAYNVCCGDTGGGKNKYLAKDGGATVTVVVS